MTDTEQKKKNNKIFFIFFAVFAAVLIGGANAQITAITCFAGLLCDPSTITATGNITLRNATTTQIGGVVVTNCSVGSFVNGWNSTSGATCGTPSGASGFIKQITLGVGLGGNESPVTSNSTLFLKNATTTEIGGLFAGNCTGNLHVSGVDTGNVYRCSGDARNGTVESVTCDEVGVTCNPSEITQSGVILLKNATLTTLGGTQLTNCSTGFYLNGWNATNKPNCVGELNNGTVTSITASTGLSGGVITTSGTIALLEALTGTIGGTRVANCSAGSFVDGWSATNIPRCTAGGSGTVTSISANNGLTINPSPLTTTGTIMGANASTGVLGVSSTLNCSGTDKVSGWAAGGAPVCSADSGGGGGSSNGQPYYGFTNRQYGWLRPLGTTATVFTSVGLAAFVVNGTPAAHALQQGYYIRYPTTAAINNSGGLTQTAIQTQARYLPILRTSIMTNASNSNVKYWTGFHSAVNWVYFTSPGGMSGAGLSFNTNRSDTNWMCCSNDATVGGMTCTSTGISMTINQPYNLTVNLTNYPTNFECVVQNVTNTGTVTKSTNLPVQQTNLAMATVMTNNDAVIKNYAIRYVYFESK